MSKSFLNDINSVLCDSSNRIYGVGKIVYAFLSSLQTLPTSDALAKLLKPQWRMTAYYQLLIFLF